MACPRTIIIIGSGVFGLSTAYAMARDDAFAQTSILLLDGWEFEPSGTATGISVSNPGSANHDTSRIIRSEYPHGPYAVLAKNAHAQWRGLWGENGRYVERRLLLSAQGSSLRNPKVSGETVNYVKNAYELSGQLSSGGKSSLQVLDSLYQIRTELGLSASASAVQNTERDLRGYISQDAGWADSGATMTWLRQKVLQTGRIRIQTGNVQSLIYVDATTLGQNSVVRGVRLDNGHELFADLTIVAAGSHTPRLLEMDTLCDVYSELVAYIQLSPEECHHFRQLDIPIIVNADRCVFAIAPDREGGLVDVRQCAGVTVGPRPNRLPPREQWSDPHFGWGGEIDLTKGLDERGQQTLADYRAFLDELFVSSGVESEGKSFEDIARRPFTKIRRCWYTDTPGTDFVIDYHPASACTLFVASGGSDHAFKFLPVIGEKIVAIVLQGRGVPSDSDDDANLTVLREAWRFPRISSSNL
ncbi:FAD dependent oxidoreductase [Penicillium mononematosum]|uniref:FAD dependent oxidoreductase n=1 Tax=Penicillium mononematosum TaxID=268346 RepID=UPI002547ACEA|nr:FAD dependent oxidoreductase [Penicillium mononematosum]KAJ6189894.1 FAD dependent oxidoreductase [Penicillium mononematosum]